MKDLKKIANYALILIVLLLIKTLINTLFVESKFRISSFFYMFFIFFIYFSIPLVLASLAVNHVRIFKRKKLPQKLIIGVVIGIGLFLYYYLVIGIDNEKLNIDKKWLVLFENIVLGICLIFINGRLIRTNN